MATGYQRWLQDGKGVGSSLGLPQRACRAQALQKAFFSALLNHGGRKLPGKRPLPLPTHPVPLGPWGLLNRDMTPALHTLWPDTTQPTLAGAAACAPGSPSAPRYWSLHT